MVEKISTYQLEVTATLTVQQLFHKSPGQLQQRQKLHPMHLREEIDYLYDIIT